MSNDQKQMTAKPGDIISGAHFVSTCFAWLVLPFTRTRFGREAGGISMLITALALLLCGGLGRDTVMTTFGGLWLFAVIVQRIRTFALLRSGEVIHSRFHGRPLLAGKVPFLRADKDVILFVEPMGCFLTGVLLMSLSQTLGLMLMATCFALLIKAGIEMELTRKRLQAMQDAHVEGTYYGEKFNQVGKE